ncbi:MAG: PH domain-containing protein [Deltaproteobacteria bacterium]
MDDSKIFAIERPHPNLLKVYFFRSLLAGPGFFVMMAVLFFRYSTLRYTFDAQGIGMRWGILFRREVNVTYARIQDIHLTSGIVQRWLGLADVQVQTASGSSAAEVTIEGLQEFEMIRDFLYARMRGVGAGTKDEAPAANTVAVSLLRDIAADVRAVREAVTRDV